jgi:hypothetical protein
MPKRLSKRPTDVNQLAYQTVSKLTGQQEPVKPSRSEISRIMSAMGRKGGKKSAKSRMTLLTKEQRSNIALNAAKARWAVKQDQPIGNASKLK